MLLPLIFLGASFSSYLILGLIVLAFVPGLRLTFFNLLLFLVGAYAGMIGALFLYGRALFMMGDELSTAPLYGLLAILLTGGAASGALFVWLKMRLMKGFRSPKTGHVP